MQTNTLSASFCSENLPSFLFGSLKRGFHVLWDDLFPVDPGRLTSINQKIAQSELTIDKQVGNQGLDGNQSN